MKWVFVFSTFGIPIRVFAKTLYCSKQTCSMAYGHEFVLILRHCNIIQWVGEHAFCQDWMSHVPAFLSASMSVWFVKLSWRPKGMVRCGTDSCANAGKESKQPPPPQTLSLPLKRILSPSDICPKQFWDFSRKFSEIFRNISNILRYFVRPLFLGFCDPPKFFRYFFEHLSLLSERFSEHFDNFPLHFGHFRDTFGPVPVTRSDHCVTIPGTLHFAEPQPVVFQLGTFHQRSAGPPQNKRLWHGEPNANQIRRYNLGHIQH